MLGALLGALGMYVYLRRQGMKAPLPQIRQFERRLQATFRRAPETPVLTEDVFPEELEELLPAQAAAETPYRILPLEREMP